MSCHTPSPRSHSILASPNSTMNETALLPEMEPILPDLCIEQLWTESSSISRCTEPHEFRYPVFMSLRAWSPEISVVSVLGREKGCQASKVFITSDLCENRYLCFLVESQQQLRWMCGLYFFKFNFYINSIDHFAFLVFNYSKALALSCISFVCCWQVC